MMEVKERTYYDSDCKEKHCSLCVVSSKIQFILRGLPKEYSKINNSNNGIDSHYIYIPSQQQQHQEEDNYTTDITENIKLRGYFDHGIQLCKGTGMKHILKTLGKNDAMLEIIWFSNSALGKHRVGHLSLDKNKLPFGKHTWKLNRRGYPNEQKEISLKLTSVRHYYSVK